MPDFDESGKFAKGNSFSFVNHPENINKGGRPKGRSLKEHLRKLIDDDTTGEKLCDALVKSAIEKALRGDFRFWQEIINRIDGKVPNRFADAEGGSLTFILDEAVQSLDSDGEKSK